MGVVTSKGQAVQAALLVDHRRPNKVIAQLAGVSESTVRTVRVKLESAGRIPRWRMEQQRCTVPMPTQLGYLRSLPVMPPELDHGACVGHPEPDLWTSGEPGDTERAIAVCRACPVRAACLAWALTLPSWPAAVYGGTSSWQRSQLKRERHQQQAS